MAAIFRFIKAIQYLMESSKYRSKKYNSLYLHKGYSTGFWIQKKQGNLSVRGYLQSLEPAKNIKEIQNVKFGYYLKDFNVIQGQAVPVWRIVADGEVYYINGFTGMLE